MKRKNMTRNALFTSILAMLLCVSLLVGTTFAWFSETVVSDRNVISAGNLDIELYHSNRQVTVEPVDSSEKLFGDITLWEPGAVVYENLDVRNVGSLALQYSMTLNVLDETVIKVKNDAGEEVKYKLSDAIQVGVVPGGVSTVASATDDDRTYVLDQVTAWTNLSGFNFGQMASELMPGGSAHVGVVLYWAPISNEFDNIFNLKNDRREDEQLKLEIGVNLVATQVMEESDSFGDDYDEEVALTIRTEAAVREDGSATLTVLDAPSDSSKMTTVEALPGTYTYTQGRKISMAYGAVNRLRMVLENGKTVALMAFDLTDPDGSSPRYRVTTYVSKGLDIASIDHIADDGTVTAGEASLISYDSATGKLVYETTHFSTYGVKSKKAVAYSEETDTAYNTVETAAAAIDNNVYVVIDTSKTDEIVAKIQNEEKKNSFVEDYSVAKIGTNKYMTLQAAFADANDGDTIELIKDATLGNNVTIKIPSGKRIVLDTNGMEVTGTADKSGNQELFLVEGNLTVNDGTIMYEALNNQGWNAMAAIFDITAGGSLTMNNVTAAVSGTDMNFIVHMNNWGGDLTLDVNNCALYASYIPVRVFNSGPFKNNVSIDNSLLHGGSYSFWVHNYTSADFGGKEYSGASAAYDAAKVDARLNFDIFNNGNTFTTGKDYPIRYGYTGSSYSSATGEKYVSSADVLKVALAQGGVVTLVSDITVNETISVSDVDVTLNLNGYDLNASENDTRPFYFYGDSDVTINAAGSEIKFGMFGFVDLREDFAGTLTINGGTFNGTTVNGSFVKVRSLDNRVDINMNGVTVTDNSTNGGAIFDGTINGKVPSAHINVNNCKFDAYRGFISFKGGSFKNTTMNVDWYGINNPGCNGLVVDGCTINVSGSCAEQSSAPSAAVAISSDYNMTVKNSTLNATTKDAVAVYTSGGTINLENCTVTGTYGIYHGDYDNKTFGIYVDGVVANATCHGAVASGTVCAHCSQSVG